MSTVKYDKDSNTLQIGKKDNGEQSSNVSPADIIGSGTSQPSQAPQSQTSQAETQPQEVRKLKGFILTVTDVPEDIERIRNGQFPESGDKVRLFPALASTDEEAIQAAVERGFAVIHIAPYEFLKFQLELIESVAEKSNVEILVDNNLFKVQELNKLD